MLFLLQLLEFLDIRNTAELKTMLGKAIQHDSDALIAECFNEKTEDEW